LVICPKLGIANKEINAGLLNKCIITDFRIVTAKAPECVTGPADV